MILKPYYLFPLGLKNLRTIRKCKTTPETLGKLSVWYSFGKWVAISRSAILLLDSGGGRLCKLVKIAMRSNNSFHYHSSPHHPHWTWTVCRARGHCSHLRPASNLVLHSHSNNKLRHLESIKDWLCDIDQVLWASLCSPHRPASADSEGEGGVHEF